MVDETSRRRLGELLEPFSKVRPEGNVVDRRGEGAEMAPPYLGQTYHNVDDTFNWLLQAEALRRRPTEPLAKDAGIEDIREPPAFTLEEMIMFLTPPAAIKGPR